MAIPVYAGAVNVRYSGAGVAFLEERQYDGSALATPDTWHKVSLIGTIKFTRKGDTTNKKVTVNTNAANQEINAIAAYDAGNSGLSTSAPDIVVEFPFLESSAAHLDFYGYVRGKYFNLCLPLGNHPAGATNKWIDWFGFGQFDNGGDISFDSTKATEIPLKFTINTNVVADTVATLTSVDTLIKATAATIAQYAGEIRVAT